LHGGRVGLTFFHPENLTIDQKNGNFLTPIFIFQSHLPLGSTTTMSQNVNRANSKAAADKKAAMQANSEWFFAKADKKGAWVKGGLSEPETEESDTDVAVATPLAREPHGPGMYQDVLPTPKLERKIAYHPPVVASDFESDGDDDGMLGRNNTPIPKPVKRLPAKGKKNRMNESDDDFSDFDIDAAFGPKIGLKATLKRKSTVVLSDSDQEGKHRKVVKVKTVKKEEGRGALAQRWAFVWNNPTMDGDEFAEFLESKVEIEKAVFSLEKGKQGTEHFQGFLTTNKRMFTTGFHKMMSPVMMGVKHAIADDFDNHAYCTKEDSHLEGPWYIRSTAADYKPKKGKKGDRTDLDDYAKLVLTEGGINKKVIEAMPGHALRFGKHGDDLVNRIKYQEEKERVKAYWKQQYKNRAEGKEWTGQEQRECVLMFGPTAVGKTTEANMKAYNEFGDEDNVFEKPHNKWWGHYTNEEHVIFDEYKGQQTIDDFKQLTNKGLVGIEGKGTEKLILAKYLWFTSNCHPSRWWQRNANEWHNWNSPDYKAVVRRFKEVWWWNDAQELTILKNPGPKQDTVEWKRAWAKWQRFWEWRDAAVFLNVNVDDDMYFTL